MLKKLHDFRIYLLLIPALAALFYTAPDVATTWAQLGLALPVLTGLALAFRKFIFHVDMSLAADVAIQSPQGAGMVVLADRIFLASVFLGGIQWLHH